MILPNQLVLFQGDSITDAERNRERLEINDRVGLGTGYAARVAAELMSQRPADQLRFLNRGVSGNRVTDLLARWPKEAVPLRPDWISILVGINDCWHFFRSNTGTDLKRFGPVYRLLLEFTRDALPQTRLVLCEPFALACGGFEQEWLGDLAERRAVVRQLAQEFDAVFVPFQSFVDELAKEAPPEYWLYDGVHPTIAGHTRLAAFWIKHVAEKA